MAEIREYFQRVEEFFCRQRGAPLLLSPLDFAKVAEWHEAGISAETVEAGVARYFEKLSKRRTPLRRAICLSFAEDCVLQVLEERRTAAIGRSAGAPESEPRAKRVERFLLSRALALEAFLSKEGTPGSYPVLSRSVASALDSLRGLLPRSDEPFSALERVLAPLDQEVGRLAVMESPQASAQGWREAALGRLSAVSTAIAPAAAEATIERMVRQSAMGELALPRLSLLFMEAE